MYGIPVGGVFLAEFPDASHYPLNADCNTLPLPGINKRGVIEYGGAGKDVLAIVWHFMQHQSLDGELPLLMFNSADNLAEQFSDQLKPLGSSKGVGDEMVYVVRPDRFPHEVLDTFFVWGLDFT